VIPNWRSASNHAWLWPAIRAGWKFINPGQFMVLKNHPPGPSHPFSPSFNCHFGDTPSSRHTGKFPKMWVPLQHPFINRIFHYKPSSYWGTAILRNPPYIYIILNVIRIHYEFPIYFLVFPISLPSFTRKPRPFPAPGVATEPVAGRSARAAAAAAASLGDEAGGFRPSPGVNKKAGFLHGKMGKP